MKKQDILSAMTTQTAAAEPQQTAARRRKRYTRCIAVRLSPDVYDTVQRIAAEERESATAVLRGLVYKALDTPAGADA